MVPAYVQVPIITTTALPVDEAGVPYLFQMQAINGIAPYTWTASGLPAGLSISTGGLITGTPTVSGNFVATFIATDSSK